MSTKTENESGTQAVAEDGSLLDSLLEGAVLSSADADAVDVAKRGVSAFMSELLTSGDKFKKVDRTAVDLMISEIDKRLESQVNEIMHAQEFQKLESTWRSLKYLVDHSDARQNVQVEVVNTTKQDLIDDFEDSPEIVKSGYYRSLYTNEYGTFGGVPYGAVVTDFDFSNGFEDIRLMQNLASVSAMAHVPLLANTPPDMFGDESFDGLPKMRDLKAHFEGPEYAKWRAFRENDDSRYIGLCMPRFMLRQPYEPGQNTERAFHFVEDVREKHDNYLWGPASFAMAARCAEAFASSSWCADIIGPQSGGEVEDLPLHQYEAMGKLQTKLPVEVQLSERREYELSEEGFIGLTFRKGSDNAAFFSANSVQKPKTFGRDDKDSELNYRLGTQLPYMFLISRVAHYLKVMQRELIGSYISREILQSRLQWWLTQHTCKEASTPFMKSKFPFKESGVWVEDVPGNAGWYKIRLQVVPHFKYMGADFSLSLVGKLDKSLAAED
jgi:type VI secretion system protein ImpC